MQQTVESVLDLMLQIGLQATEEDAKRVVSHTILALADNVTDEMVEAFKNKLEPYTDASGFNYHAALGAALRAVTGKGEG